MDSAGLFHRETGWDTTPAWKRLARAVMKIPSGSCQNPQSIWDLCHDQHFRASEALGDNSSGVPSSYALKSLGTGRPAENKTLA